MSDVKIYGAYMRQKKKAAKIKKMQTEISDLNDSIVSVSSDFDDFVEDTLKGFVKRRIKTNVSYEDTSRKFVIYNGGIGYVDSYSERTHYYADTDKFFRENGDRFVKDLTGRLPDGKLEVLKKIVKYSKKMLENDKTYERKLTLQVIGGIKEGEDGDFGRFGEIGGQFRLVMDSGGLSLCNDRHTWDLSIISEDASETMYRYMMVEQVYGDCVKFMKVVMNDSKKRLKHNKREFERLQDAVNNYRVLREL